MMFLDFIRDNLPTWSMLAWSPVMLAWSLAALALAGWLKQSRGWKTGYTRKVFHFITFATVAGLLCVPREQGGGMPAVCLFGVVTSLVVFYAMFAGHTNIQAVTTKTPEPLLNANPQPPTPSPSLLYSALAREKDAPHQTWFIFVSYLATLVGGLLSSIYFTELAIVGFLITGVADAVAEPVGTRFGKHRYRVPSLSSTVSHRSLEGSAAVFIASLVCLVIAAAVAPAIGWHFAGMRALAFLGIAAIVTLAEAVSPHGWDNLTMQVLPTWLAWAWLT